MIVRLLTGIVAGCLSVSSPLIAQDIDQNFVVDKLRVHCKACHAVGQLKFITSDQNEVVWDYLWHTESPRSGGLWGDLIIEVLEWPGDRPPPPDEFMDPPGRDWMPKGNKRNLLAADTHEGVPVRRLILRYMKTSY